MSRNRNLSGFHFAGAPGEAGVVEAAQGDYLLVKYFDDDDTIASRSLRLELVPLDAAAEQGSRFWAAPGG